MSYNFPPEIRTLVDQNMALGVYASEEHLLQAALGVLSEYHATIGDIRHGMNEYEEGKGELLSEAFAGIRQQIEN